jgi:hypothetical protein
LTDTISPDEREPGSSGLPVNAMNETTDADIVLSQNDDQGLTLHLGKDLKADVLDLSLKATPPGKYVKRSPSGKIGWSNNPQYFSFNKIEQSKIMSVFVLEEPRVASRVPFDSCIEIASEDGFLAASVVWKVRPRAGVIYKYRLWIATVLVLGVGLIAAAASNFSPIRDFACARWSVCSADQIALQDVKSCSAQAAVCGQAVCTLGFKSKFSSSRLIPLVERIEEDGAARCRAADDDKYAGVSHCVQEKINADSCNVRSCFVDYDMTQASERVSQAQTIMAVAAERCRQLTLSATAERQQPAAEHQPSASAAPQPILNDGSHQAIQRYTGPRSRADPINCPASASFVVDVRGESFTYSRPDFFDGASITRTWVGTIDQTTGQVAILGSKGSPPTKNAMTVVGAHDNATVLSDFCGSGVFKIER